MTEPHVTEQELDQPKADTAAPATRPDVVTMGAVLRQVRRDSHKQPEAYLDETTVRYGGE